MIPQRLLRILIYLIALTTITAAVSGCIVEDDDGEGDGDDTNVDVDNDDNDTDDDFGGANPTPYQAGPVRGTS